MMAPREQVLRTARALADELGAIALREPAAAARLRRGEDGFEEALARACASTGTTPEAYAAALDADGALAALASRAVDEALVAPPDVGPNDAISRESPSGTIENAHVHANDGIIPPGGVGGS